MSFASPEIQNRILKLKQQFEEIDTQTPPNLTIDKGNLDSHFLSVRLAVISNFLRTLENSLDQISICFEVSRAIFFFQNNIVNNPEFWAEERGVNQMLCSNNFKMAIADMQSAEDRLNVETEILKAQHGANQTAVKSVLSLIEKYKLLVGRFHEAATFLTEMEGRQKSGLPLYDSDQCPDIGTILPEAYLKSLNLKSSQNAEGAIRLNLELVESSFESIYLTITVLGLIPRTTIDELAL